MEKLKKMTFYVFTWLLIAIFAFGGCRALMKGSQEIETSESGNS